MKQFLLLLLIGHSATVIAQTPPDTIYTYNKAIPAHVKEIGHTDIVYSLPGEVVTYRLYKRNVLSITFGNGRREVINTRASLNPIRSFWDWDNVVITSQPDEVAGMVRIADVSTKATGATTYSSVTKTQARAFKKMKQAAALLGGNLVLLNNQSVEGNVYGERTTRTQLTGTIYRAIPLDTTGISANLSNKKFVAVQKLRLGANSAEVSTNMVSPSKFRTATFKPTRCSNGICYFQALTNEPVTEFMIVQHSAGSVTLAYKYESRFVQIAFSEQVKR